jgi:hypothetical protein
MPSSEEYKYGVEDLVMTALDQKPTEFEDAFGALMVNKVRDAVDSYKQDVATRMFGPNEEPDALENLEEPEDDLYDDEEDDSTDYYEDEEE